MRKGLLILYNSAGIENFLQIKKEFNNINWDCYIYDKYYNDSEKLRHFYNFVYRNNRKYKLFNSIYETINDKYYNVILCPSEFDSDINIYLKINNKSKIYFYETGFSDYLDENIYKRNPELFTNTIKYVNNSDYVQKKFIKDNIKIKAYQDIDLINKIYDNEIKTVKKIDNINVVLFLDPVDIDFGYLDYKDDLIEFLKKNYPNKNILIKSHPRSDIDLSDPSLKTYYCNDNLPGELLLTFLNKDSLEDIIFTYPNNILLNTESNIKLLKFDSEKMHVNLDNYNNILEDNILEKSNINKIIIN